MISVETPQLLVKRRIKLIFQCIIAIFPVLRLVDGARVERDRVIDEEAVSDSVIL
jgi:hypothetical protein